MIQIIFLMFSILVTLQNIDRKISILYDTDLLANPSQWQNLYNEASTLNQNLEANTILVQNEQWINDKLLYLANHTIKDMEAVTLEDVKTLAMQCPYIAGDAVFKARNILAPLEPNVRYDDLDICNTQGVYKGGVNNYNVENESLFSDESIAPKTLSASVIKVYPNPTDGLLKIDYKLDDDGLFNLYDLSGRLFRTIGLPKNTQHIVTDISDLANGIYSYKITSAGILLSTGKLVKD